MTKTTLSTRALPIRRRTLLAAGVAGWMSATPFLDAAAAAATASSGAADFDAWAERTAAARMKSVPEHATRMQYFEGPTQSRLDGQWDELSRASALADLARDRRALAELARFPREALTPTQRTSAALMAWTLQQDVAEAAFLDHHYVFEHMAGVHVGPITFLVQEHPMRGARDVRSYLKRMRAQLPLTTDDAGVWRLPDGDKLYAARLRANTTTELTPAEIHAIGLKQVARIEGEMDGLLRQLGYAEGTIEQRFRKMDADRQPTGAAPQGELLDRYTAYLGDAEARARLIFDVMPKASVEVRREPALTEPTAAAHYTTPAPDGSQPGVFWAPLAGPTYEIADMRTLVHHEAIPGHHFQLAIQMEARDLPYFRRRQAFSAGSAYVEGWALYAEQLAVENGWYDGDPVGHLGQLYGALFRARRLVVDTGLHAMKWTRQQAIDYGITPQEVDRYVTWPGQACAYMLGRLRIEALREKARQQLGDRFEIKQFHNVVLLTGDVPLTVLEQVVDDWVDSRRSAGSGSANAAP